MSTSTPSQIGQQFHPFPRLPFELRRTIWKLCRPHRVIDIDLTPSQEDLATACQVWQTSVRNSRPSILTRICKESRNVIFERDEGHDESLVQHTESDIFGYYTNIDWFNASTDIINLNWTPDFEYNSWNNDGNPILEFIQVAAQAVGASITVDLLCPFSIGPSPSYRYFNSYRDGANFDMLESRKQYLVTVEMVSLHVTVEAAVANGLFGVLGEERIVLISATDQEAIRKYQELWAAGPVEDREPNGFFKDALDSGVLSRKLEQWRYELEVYWLRFKCDQAIKNGTARDEDLDPIWYQTPGSEDFEDEQFIEDPGANWTGLFDVNHSFAKKVLGDMPRFSPVVMFRLCEMRCYDNESR